MKVQILNTEGKKVREKDTSLFEEPIREDIIFKVVEAEKIRQPYSNKFRAGMDRSASGNVRHRRHVWKSDRGRGLARIPKKAFWRRGTQFSWEGAIVPFTRGGRRAHPPKGSVNLAKINKKEMKKALLSALTYVTNTNKLVEKYDSLKGKKINTNLPFIIEGKIFELNSKHFLESLKKILGEFHDVAIQKKTIRPGKGKVRGRKYKKNAGLLFVVGKDENKKIKGIEIVKVHKLNVSDLASGGARLTLFSEKAIDELETLTTFKKRDEKIKYDKKEKYDKRRINRDEKNNKNKIKKTKEKEKDA